MKSPNLFYILKVHQIAFHNNKNHVIFNTNFTIQQPVQMMKIVYKNINHRPELVNYFAVSMLPHSPNWM